MFMAERIAKLVGGMPVALLSALLAISACANGGPGGAVVGSPVEESQESPASERAEEGVAIVRQELDRSMRPEARCWSKDLESPCSQQLGHAQHCVILQGRGHRLPNGLLAPLTC